MAEPRFFLPAFMYGRNRGEAPQNVPNEFPRLRAGQPARPSSSWWMVRSDRLSHPAALVYDSGRVYGLCAGPYFIKDNGLKRQWQPERAGAGAFYQYGGFSCSLANGSVGYTLGYENAPLMFIKSRLVKERAPIGANAFRLEAGETVDFEMLLYDYEAASELGINEALEQVYYRYYQQPRPGSDIATAASDLSKAIYQYAWLPEEQNYSTFVYENKETGGFRYNKILSNSWTGGLTAAVPVLLGELRLGDGDMRQQALSCIDNIVRHSLNPGSGLPFEAFNNGLWSNKGWWFDCMRTPGHSAYLVGQACYFLMKAYEYEKRLGGQLHGVWMDFVNEVLQRLENVKNSDGEYPAILSSVTGAGLEYDSFSGTWCMAALAYYSWLTGDRRELDGLKRSERHYYETYLKRMECYGAPLDADKAVDSEGILAYMKAVRYIHAMTG